MNLPYEVHYYNEMGIHFKTKQFFTFADANDCGKCFTWEEVIGAFRALWTSGERVPIK